MTQQEMTYSQLSGESYRALRKHSVSVGVCLLISFLAQEIIILVLYLFGFGDLLENNLSFQYSVYSLLLTVGAMMMPFFLYSLRKGRMSYIKALPFHSDVSSPEQNISTLSRIDCVSILFTLSETSLPARTSPRCL